MALGTETKHNLNQLNLFHPQYGWSNHVQSSYLLVIRQGTPIDMPMKSHIPIIFPSYSHDIPIFLVIS